MTLADEFRDKRLAAGLSQAKVAAAAGISRSRYTALERGQDNSLTVLRACQVAGVLGLDLPIRTYPGAEPLRDVAQLERLMFVLRHTVSPLSFATEVACRRHRIATWSNARGTQSSSVQAVGPRSSWR